MADYITQERAKQLNNQWFTSGYHAALPRLAIVYRGGSGDRVVLYVPGYDTAPLYEFHTHDPSSGLLKPGYYAAEGCMTVAEWLKMLDEIEMECDAAEARRDASDLRASLYQF